MRFLRPLRITWSDFSQGVRAALGGPPISTEPLTRFLTSRSHRSPLKRRVKYQAFLPAPSSNVTSVFRIAGLSERMIWKTGDTYISSRTLHGRADVAVQQVVDVGLQVVPDNTPRRHANITGWPTEKSKKMSLAQELAAAASLVLQ